MKTIASQIEKNPIEQIAPPSQELSLVNLSNQPEPPATPCSQDAQWKREIWGEPHNGWSNYETWSVYFSIAGEDAIYRHWLGRAAKNRELEALKKQKREHGQHDTFEVFNPLFSELCNAFYCTPLVSKFGIYSELLMVALGNVDWQRLASALQKESANNSHDASSSRVRNSLTDGRIRFSAGGVTASPGVLEILSQKELVDAVIRHQRGDWGHVNDELRQANEAVIHDEGRLVSAYETKNNVEFWMITDYDRAATNVLLPTEY